ncbi:antigen 5 like allergen Cul n 1-like [Anastrepha obliqua]|uniref:antigen 5 like allergen Cul n 1-like n=1 Tax=Anastrepha obliqua TaxID=95512 RepID=UPI002409E06A|nr:antigen 5 like allergen Cul n 1-like [Anastrepha obliqua]
MSFRFKLVIFYFGLFDCCWSIAAYNYFCSSDNWCSKGNHLMCDTSAIKEQGTFKRHMPLTFKVRRLFLEHHNKIRDKTAGSSKATRMRNLIWDNELAYLARTHTGLCSNNPSECHRTARFEKVGLNTALQNGSDYIQIDHLISNSFKEWEPDSSTAHKVLTHDQASRVGCAIGHCVDCADKKDHCYFISCFYDMDHKEGETTQETGDKAASKCNVWDSVADEKYANLCHNTGKNFQKN